MMRKIIAYQKLLFCSVTSRAVGKEIMPTQSITFFLAFLVCLTMGPLIGLSTLNLAIPFASASRIENKYIFMKVKSRETGTCSKSRVLLVKTQ